MTPEPKDIWAAIQKLPESQHDGMSALVEALTGIKPRPEPTPPPKPKIEPCPGQVWEAESGRRQILCRNNRQEWFWLMDEFQFILYTDYCTLHQLTNEISSMHLIGHAKITIEPLYTP